MNLDSELPNSHRNHEIERLSERYFDSIFPIEWVKNHFRVDYGTDYNCEIAKNKGVTGINFTVQMKGKETESNNNEISVSNIKRSTINRWLNRLEPTMIVVYLVDENEAYWIWFENTTVDLTLKNKTFSIKLPKKNKLSQIKWEEISKQVETIFSRKNLLYEYPKIDDTNQKAWGLYFEQKYIEALPLLKEISKTKSDGLIWNAIAMCQYNLFHYQEALISINKSFVYNNDNIAIKNKAAILIEQGIYNKESGKIEEGITIYKNLIEKGDVTDSIYYNYGSALTNLGRYEEALVVFEKAITINPNKAETWNNLGNVFQHLKLHFREQICYDNALQINPNLTEALFSKGSSLFRYFNKVDEGLELMLKASEISTRYELDFPYMFWWISEAYLVKEDVEKAIEWNKRGLDIFSTDNYLLHQRESLNFEN